MGADLFGPQDVPRMVALGDLRGVDLTAEEGYLLSRIDGRINVGALLSVVSWEREKTMSLLESLLRKHVVNFDRQEIHDKAFGAATSAPGSANPAPSSSARPATRPSTPSAMPSISKDGIEKVPDLDPDRCVAILEWEQIVTAASTPYQAFSLPDGADMRSVKRRYREMAMTFHPDKFFRKEIGGYRQRIEDAWKRVQEAYEVLQDPEKRGAWEQAAREGRTVNVGPPPSDPGKPAPGAKEVVSGPGKAPVGIAAPLKVAPLDDFERLTQPDPPPSVSRPPAGAAANPDPPRPQMESALARKLKKEVQERIDKARTFFEQAQKDLAENKHALADSNLKLALQYDPKNDEYREFYERVKAKLEEGIVSSLLRKAEMAAVSSDVKTERESYDHALSLFPDNLAVNLALGAMLVRQETDPKRAKQCLEKVVAKRPDDLTALVGLAKALRLLGMVKNAHRILEQAKAVDPRDSRVVFEAKELRKVS